MATNTNPNEKEMIQNAQINLRSTLDPMEKLKLQCLQRGVTGIMDFGRLLMFTNVVSYNRSFCATYD